MKIINTSDATFQVFEVVDCATKGSTPKAFAEKNGHEQTYCIPAEPIITRKHLKSSDTCKKNSGEPFLNIDLTEEGAQRMEKVTQRLLAKHRAKTDRARVAIFIKGKLISVPILHDVIQDRFLLEGFTDQEMQSMVEALGGSRECHSIMLGR